MQSGPVIFAVTAAVAVAVLVVVAVGAGSLFWLAGRLFAMPGVVVHEFAHRVACDLVGVPVLKVVYFRFGDPAGYVRHAQPKRYRASFAIGVAPFIVNTVVAFGAFLGLAALVSRTGDLRSAPIESIATGVALGWLGLSIGTSAFPSTGDANALWTRSRTEWRRSPIVLFGIPVVAVIYAANLLSWLWADVLYAIGLLVLAFQLAGLVAI